MKPNEITNLNRELLGPVFYRFLYKLYASQLASDPNNSVILFLSRGGIRIRYFYEQFLKANDLEPPLPYSDYYVSRMAVIKASLLSNYDTVYQDFIREYAWSSIEETIRSFFGNYYFNAWKNISFDFDAAQPVNSDTLNSLLWSDTEGAEYLRTCLHEQEQNYKQYLDQKIGPRSHVILVDTGWSGSILNYMQSFDEQREYVAHFFGRYNYGRDDLPWFNRVIGIEVEDRQFNRSNSVSSLFLNRHLIEGLCEIRWQSVEGYKTSSSSNNSGLLVEPLSGTAPEEYIVPGSTEYQAHGVLEYVCEAADKMNITEIHDKAEKAAKSLKNLLMYPGKKAVKAFSVPSRSADFGKNLDVPFFVSREKNPLNVKQKLKNIHNSMWPAGQIYQEFPFGHIIVQQLYHNRMRILRVLRKLRVSV